MRTPHAHGLVPLLRVCCARRTCVPSVSTSMTSHSTQTPSTAAVARSFPRPAGFCTPVSSQPSPDSWSPSTWWRFRWDSNPSHQLQCNCLSFLLRMSVSQSHLSLSHSAQSRWSAASTACWTENEDTCLRSLRSWERPCLSLRPSCLSTSLSVTIQLLLFLHYV